MQVPTASQLACNMADLRVEQGMANGNPTMFPFATSARAVGSSRVGDVNVQMFRVNRLPVRARNVMAKGFTRPMPRAGSPDWYGTDQPFPFAEASAKTKLAGGLPREARDSVAALAAFGVGRVPIATTGNESGTARRLRS